MKKIKLSLLFFILMFPVIINARTYDTAKKYVNDYRLLFKDYNKYLVTESTKYELTNDKLIINDDFINGGLISKTEYELSQKHNYSSTYLYDGSNYWTLTNNTLVTPDGISTSNTNDSGVRVTQYVRGTTKVTGAGSINTPYVFSPEYTITFITNDAEYGTLGKTRKSNGKIEVVEKGLSVVTQKVLQGDKISVELEPMPGYKYLNNTCEDVNATDTDMNATQTSNGDFVELKNVKKDTTCRINFGIGIFKVSLKNTCPTGIESTDGTTELYLRYDEGWYYNENSDTIASYITVPTCEGHDFLGYKTDTGKTVINANGLINSGTTKVFKQESIIETVWVVNSYDLRINPNSGKYNNTEEITTITQEYASTYTIQPLTAEPNYSVTFDGNGSTNYTKGVISTNRKFLKWELNGPGTINNNLYTFGPGDAEITAIYNTIAQPLTAPSLERKYTITYDLNGESANISKSSDIISYTMTGWYTSPTSGTFRVGNNEQYTPDKTETLYARWEPKSTTIQAAIKEGYTCNWYDGTEKLENGSSYTPKNNVTLKLKCVANEYTVGINNGSCGTSSLTEVHPIYGSNMPRIDSIYLPSKTGYIFQGYYIGSEKYYNADGTSAKVWKIPSNTSDALTAKCTPIKYTVEFNCGEGSGSMASMTDIEYDQSKTLTANGCTAPVSKKFDKWKSNYNKTYSNKATIKNLTTKNGDTITMTAQYILDKFTITYNPNGVNSSAFQRQYDYNGTTEVLPGGTFSNIGTNRSFYAWNTKADGTGTYYYEGGNVADLISPTSSGITLYAIWLTQKTTGEKIISVSVGAKKTEPYDVVSLSSYKGKVMKAKVTTFEAKGKHPNSNRSDGKNDGDVKFSIIIGSTILQKGRPLTGDSYTSDKLGAGAETLVSVSDTNVPDPKIKLEVLNSATALGTFTGSVKVNVTYWVLGE